MNFVLTPIKVAYILAAYSCIVVASVRIYTNRKNDGYFLCTNVHPSSFTQLGINQLILKRTVAAVKCLFPLFPVYHGMRYAKRNKAKKQYW